MGSSEGQEAGITHERSADFGPRDRAAPGLGREEHARVEGVAPERVRLYFKAPREAPTTRGFAGVLHEGLDGLSAAEILAVPDDMPELLGLTRAITPLRMRGMTAMLGRIKRKVVASGDRQPSAQS